MYLCVCVSTFSCLRLISLIKYTPASLPTLSTKVTVLLYVSNMNSTLYTVHIICNRLYELVTVPYKFLFTLQEELSIALHLVPLKTSSAHFIRVLSLDMNLDQAIPRTSSMFSIHTTSLLVPCVTISFITYSWSFSTCIYP